jgi:hypothetical protein
MQPPFRFKCASCGEWHTGIPGWGWNYTSEYSEVPQEERETRCFLTTDLCVVDHRRYFVCGCIEAPVRGFEEILSLRVWLEVTKVDFFRFQSLIGVKQRAKHGPFTGRLSVSIPTFEETDQLPVDIVIRNDGIRPYVRVLSETHQLAFEQNTAVPVERVQALYNHFEHGRAEA